jgi:hypothetical protein
LRTNEGWPDPPRGAASIADELRRSGWRVRSMIHRVLVRNGLVSRQSEKRPRASYTRFGAAVSSAELSTAAPQMADAWSAVTAITDRPPSGIEQPDEALMRTRAANTRRPGT